MAGWGDVSSPGQLVDKEGDVEHEEGEDHHEMLQEGVGGTLDSFPDLQTPRIKRNSRPNVFDDIRPRQDTIYSVLTTHLQIIQMPGSRTPIDEGLEMRANEKLHQDAVQCSSKNQHSQLHIPKRSRQVGWMPYSGLKFGGIRRVVVDCIWHMPESYKKEHGSRNDMTNE